MAAAGVAVLISLQLLGDCLRVEHCPVVPGRVQKVVLQL